MDDRQLQVTLADGRVQTFALDQPSVSVGRAEENGVHLDDLSVSRRHARFILEDGDLYIEDLGSGSGTFIGAKQLAPRTRYVIDDGDALRFGDVQARCDRTAPARRWTLVWLRTD